MECSIDLEDVSRMPHCSVRCFMERCVREFDHALRKDCRPGVIIEPKEYDDEWRIQSVHIVDGRVDKMALTETLTEEDVKFVVGPEKFDTMKSYGQPMVIPIDLEYSFEIYEVGRHSDKDKINPIREFLQERFSKMQENASSTNCIFASVTKSAPYRYDWEFSEIRLIGEGQTEYVKIESPYFFYQDTHSFLGDELISMIDHLSGKLCFHLNMDVCKEGIPVAAMTQIPE